MSKQHKSNSSNVKRVPGAAIKTGPRSLAQAREEERVDPLLWGILVFLMVSLGSIVVSMTPFTYQLDDIKESIFLVAGPFLMLMSLLAMGLGVVPWPSKVTGWALAAFGVAMFISLMAAEANAKWIGWQESKIFWAAAGYFMAATAVGSHPRTSRIFARYVVIQLLAIELIGIFMFDMSGSNKHHSGVGWLFHFLYGRSPTSTAVSSLLWTLFNADSTMQSTILNRDFYAAFLVMYLPFAMCMGLHPAKSERPLFWRILGGVTALLAIICVFLCQSKGEYVVTAVVTLSFLLLYLKVDYAPELSRHHIFSWVIGAVLVLGALGWMRTPTLIGQLKSVKASTDSRGIMWKGAWEIFKHNPIVGSGPGAYAIYFSEYRARDYFNHEIANVTNYSHDYYLDVLSEEGIVGLTCFVVFLGSIAFGALRWIFTHPDRRLRMLLLAGLLGMAGTLASNMTSPNGRWVIGASSMWTILGFFSGFILQAKGATGSAVMRPAELIDSLSGSQAGERGSSEARDWRPVLQSAGLWGLVMLSVVVLWASTLFSYHYFNGMVKNADGLGIMENVYAMMDARKINNEQMIGELLQSYPLFEEAIEENPNNISSYYKVGSVYVTLSRAFRSLATQAAHENKPEEAIGYDQQADQYLVLSKKRYEDTLRLSFDYAEIHYNTAIVYQDYADYIRRMIAHPNPPPAEDKDVKFTEALAKDYDDKALREVERMGRLSSKEEVAEQQGGLYQEFHLYDKAADVLAGAVKDYPDDQNLANLLDRAAQQSGDPKRIVGALRHRWDLATGDNGLLTQLLSTCYTKGLDTELKGNLDRLAEVNPVHPLLFEYRMKLAERDKQTTEVSQAFHDFAVIEPPGKADMYWLGAEAARQSGNLKLAESGYLHLVQTDKDGQSTYGQQARLRLRDLTGQTSGSQVLPLRRPAETSATLRREPSKN